MQVLNTKDAPKTIKCGLCRTECGRTPYRLRVYNYELRADLKGPRGSNGEADDYARKFTLCEKCMSDLCDRLGIH